jgi:hypothetical protein
MTLELNFCFFSTAEGPPDKNLSWRNWKFIKFAENDSEKNG